MKKDVDQLLQESRAPKPRRELAADFTTRVLADITNPPKKKREWWARYLHIPHLALLPKPLLVLAVVCSALLTSGITYAAITNWPAISAVFKEEKRLPSGNRIVSIDTDNCMYSDTLDGTAKPSGKRLVHYEIKKDSPLTNEQVASMVRGICEENVANNAVSAVIKPLIDGGDHGQGITSTLAYRITAIDEKQIRLLLDPQYDRNMMIDADKELLYNRFAANVKVYDGTGPIEYNQLKSGDTVNLVIRRDSPYFIEVPPSDPRYDPNMFDDTDKITVEAIIKRPPLSGSPSTFYRHLAVDFVRAEPCSESPSGFCRAYDFSNNYDK